MTVDRFQYFNVTIFIHFIPVLSVYYIFKAFLIT